MDTLPIPMALYLALNLHCLIGGIAAVVAARKGRRLVPWLLIGLVGGTVALVAAIALKPLPKA
jgi:hypothetical protein